MAKIFYTERDIDEMNKRGISSVDITDNVVITDLALERAMKYEMKINRAGQTPPPKATFSPSVNLAASTIYTAVPRSSDGDLKERIRAAVIAKLDGQVDAALLDQIISRVVSSMK